MMAGVSAEGHHQALAAIVGAANVLSPSPREYLSDGTAGRGLEGRADAVVLPGSPDELAAVVAHCYAAGVPITTRGGGTGFAGGAVPQGGIVLGTARMARVRAFDPLQESAVVRSVRSVVTRSISSLASSFFLFDSDCSSVIGR